MNLGQWAKSILLLVVMSSALAVVYVKYQTRMLFAEIQRLERELDQHEVEWGRLKLEQTTLSEHNRIERLARESIQLIAPERSSIIYLKP